MDVCRWLFVPSLVLGLGCHSLSCSWPPRILAFTPSDLPNAQLGKEYRAVIKLSRNRTPIGSVRLKDGALPRGLSINQDRETGGTDLVIHGVPQGAGIFTFTIEVGCFGTSVDGQVGEKTYSLEVR